MKLKKSLGQHYLKDKNILRKITEAIPAGSDLNILEIGAGAGALSHYLMNIPHAEIKLVEIDNEKCLILKEAFKHVDIIEQDILKMNIPFSSSFFVVGNFPYYISSQILFKLLDWRLQITGVVCMLQKEVAKRICSPHHSKDYGILSVLLQSYFDITYLFDVYPSSFTPPPNIMSGVISLLPRKDIFLGDYEQLKKIVKTAFNQRRKMMRNSLQPIFNQNILNNTFFSQRPEQLTPQQFQQLTSYLKT